jgi:hypothetical protein
MPRTEYYSKVEAQLVIDHYNPLLIGKEIEENTGAFINSLRIEDWGNNVYGVIVEAPFKGSMLRMSIGNIAHKHGLQAPSAYLQEINNTPANN